MPINSPLKLSIPLLDEQGEQPEEKIPDIRISLRKLQSVPSGSNLGSYETNSMKRTADKKESMEEVLASMEREEA